ncbi:unnamed protein product, partial [Owenia fusiformis]
FNMAGKKKVSKDDLRRLMKESRSSTAKNQRIDSPLAKYNALGQLVCIVCNIHLKSEKLWNAHLMGRSHKEKHAALKAKQEAINRGGVVPSMAPPTKAAKRKLEQQTNNIPEKKPKGILVNKSTLGLGDYSSSDESDEETAVMGGQPVGDSNNMPTTENTPSLPADFFDNGTGKSNDVKNEDTEDVEVKPTTMAEKLPEGFFDNPEKDAKVREVVYKDKMEEEWELFQKSVKEETKVSEAIIDEDDEQANAVRNLMEADEQLHQWSKINSLAKEKDKIMETGVAKQGKTESNSDSDIDIDEYEEFLDWRIKGT